MGDQEKHVWPLNEFIKSYVCLTMSWMSGIGATAAWDAVFIGWMGKDIRNIHKTIVAVSHPSLPHNAGMLIKRITSYYAPVYLEKSIISFISRGYPSQIWNPLLPLCKHTVHIGVNECLLPLLAALTFPSTCYAVMNQTLLCVHCSMRRTNQGSYLEAWIMMSAQSVSIFYFFFLFLTSAHL